MSQIFSRVGWFICIGSLVAILVVVADWYASPPPSLRKDVGGSTVPSTAAPPSLPPSSPRPKQDDGYRPLFLVMNDEVDAAVESSPPAAPISNSSSRTILSMRNITAPFPYPSSWPLVVDAFIDHRGHVVTIVNEGSGGGRFRINPASGKKEIEWNIRLYSMKLLQVERLNWEIRIINSNAAAETWLRNAPIEPPLPWIALMDFPPPPPAAAAAAAAPPRFSPGSTVTLRNSLAQYPPRQLRQGLWHHLQTVAPTAPFQQPGSSPLPPPSSSSFGHLRRFNLIAALFMNAELDHHDVYLRRWIAWHTSGCTPASAKNKKKWKRYLWQTVCVEHVLVYVNRPEALDPAFMAKLRAAYDPNLVTFVPFFFRHDLLFADQVPEMYHALYSVRGAAQWLLLCDVDEYMFTKKPVADLLRRCRQDKADAISLADYRVLVDDAGTSRIDSNPTYGHNLKGKLIVHVDTVTALGVHMIVGAKGKPLLKDQMEHLVNKLQFYPPAEETKLLHFKRTLHILREENGEHAFESIVRQFFGGDASVGNLTVAV